MNIWMSNDAMAMNIVSMNDADKNLIAVDPGRLHTWLIAPNMENTSMVDATMPTTVDNGESLILSNVI
jgi:hypothetical protein